jgi:hypothetical protein
MVTYEDGDCPDALDVCAASPDVVEGRMVVWGIFCLCIKPRNDEVTVSLTSIESSRK